MLLIFDCDGVVIDSMLLHCEIESKAYGEIGIEISPQDLARRFSGVQQTEVSKILAQETGCKVPSNFDVEKEKKTVFTQRLKAIPHVQEMLDMLADIPRCIASGSDAASLKHMLGLVGLYEYFAPNIFSSEMVARGKPAPDLFLFAANEMSTEPNNCLVIEDGIAGVQAAKAAGMRVFGFTGGSHCYQELSDCLREEGAEEVISDMRELTRLIKSAIHLTE